MDVIFKERHARHDGMRTEVAAKTYCTQKTYLLIDAEHEFMDPCVCSGEMLRICYNTARIASLRYSANYVRVADVGIALDLATPDSSVRIAGI